MANVGDLVVRIRADTADLNRSLSGVQRSMQDFSRSMARVGSTLTAAVTLPLAGVGAAMVKLSVDAEETASKFSVVFGEFAGQVQAQLDEIRRFLPATTQELQAMAAGVQDLLVPMGVARGEAAGMSFAFVRLAGDIASFNNVATGEVLDAFRSALAGSSEPLRRFGVDVRDTALQSRALSLGLIEAGEEMDTAARSAAVLAQSIAGSGDAIGDAERTMDSTSNTLRRMWADTQELAQAFGDELVPAIRPAIDALQDLLRSLQNLTPEQTRFALAAGAIAVAVGPLILVLGGVTAALSFLLTPLGAVVAIISGGMVAGVAAGIAIWKAFGDEITAVIDTIDNAIDRLIEFSDNFATFGGMPFLARRERPVAPRIDFTEEQRAELADLVFGTPEEIQARVDDYKQGVAQIATEARGLFAGLDLDRQFSLTTDAIKDLEAELEQLALRERLEGPSAKLAENIDRATASLARARTEAARVADEILRIQLPDIQLEPAATIGPQGPRVSESIAREGRDRERQLRAEAQAFLQFQQAMEQSTANVAVSLADFGGLLIETAAGLVSFSDALRFGLSGIGGAVGGGLGERLSQGASSALAIAAPGIGQILGQVAGGIIGNIVGGLFDDEPNWVAPSREFANTLRDEFANTQQTIADLEKAMEFIRNVRIDFLATGPQRGFESLEQIDFVAEELLKEFERLTGTTEELNNQFTRAINIPNVFRAELARFEAGDIASRIPGPILTPNLPPGGTLATGPQITGPVTINLQAARGESGDALLDRIETALTRRARLGGVGTVRSRTPAVR